MFPSTPVYVRRAPLFSESYYYRNSHSKFKLRLQKLVVISTSSGLLIVWLLTSVKFIANKATPGLHKTKAKQGCRKKNTSKNMKDRQEKQHVISATMNGKTQTRREKAGSY